MTLSRDNYYSTREASTRREVRPEDASQCKHEDSILVIPTQTGYCALAALSIRV